MAALQPHRVRSAVCLATHAAQRRIGEGLSCLAVIVRAILSKRDRNAGLGLRSFALCREQVTEADLE